LRRVEQETAYSSALLAAADSHLNPKDRSLCHQLVLGVLRQRLWLDRCIEHFGRRQVEKLDLPVVLALRLGLYQLRFLSRVPPSAAVNESVNLVRAAKLRSAAAFANAVLRQATREPTYDPAADITDPIEKLTVETSHPRWLVERWIDQIGFEETSALARVNNRPAALAFRFTARALATTKPQVIIEELQSAGADLRSSSVAENGWRLTPSQSPETTGGDAGSNRPALSSTSLLRELSEAGLIYFQDESSQMVAELLGTQNGDRVLDVCAAPGSKATLIAARSAGAAIVAGDLYQHRVRTMKELAGQQQARNVWPITYDATQRLPFAPGSFDRVLLDAPCSGTGTLRHNPEIRWRLKPSDIIELAHEQRQMLASAAAMVRPGGVLIYSTCSLEIEEGEDIVSEFRESHPVFDPLIRDVPQTLVKTGALRTWPHRDDVDGFFVMSFRRNK
jgi:16S rRNA (cytosine967-C5)-methyltransferase